MTIEYTCPCGQRLRAQSSEVGRVMRCPACGQETTVPANAPSVELAEPLAPEVRPAPRRREAPYEDDDGQRAPRDRATGTSGKAIAALVLGFLAFCFSLLAGVPAIILGILSLGEISRSRGRLGGRGMAIAGIVLGTIGALLIGPALMIALLLPAVQNIRGAAQRIQSANNMRIQMLGIHNYADTHNGQLPPATVFGADGKPLYSWRVLILPYIGQDNLYHRFRLDEPWDSPANKPLLALIPKEFTDPADPSPQLGLTPYQVFDGPGAAFDSSSRPLKPFQPEGINQPFRLQTSATQLRLPGSFTDGMSNTILLVEAADPVPWSSPQDLSFGPGKPVPKLGRPSRKGFNLAYADASVHHAPDSMSEQTLRALITPNAGDVPGSDAP